MAKKNDGVWDYITAINQTKQNIIAESEDQIESEKAYNPFLTNRALSYYPDTIHLAQLMNINSNIGKKMQFEFLLNSVRTRKRYSKWAKTKDMDMLNKVSDLYNVNNARAKEIIDILGKETIEKAITKG